MSKIKELEQEKRFLELSIKEEEEFLERQRKRLEQVENELKFEGPPDRFWFKCGSVVYLATKTPNYFYRLEWYSLISNKVFKKFVSVEEAKKSLQIGLWEIVDSER